MKERISIHIANHLGQEGSSIADGIDRLASLFPDLVDTDKYGKEILLLQRLADDAYDERVKRLLDEIGKAGFNLWDKNSLQSGLAISLRREYSESELDQLDYLHFCDAGENYLGEMNYPLLVDAHGIPALAGKPRQKARLFGTPVPVHRSFFVVRGKAKEKLERAGLIGLQLHPVVFNRARSLAAEDHLWAVWSDRVLPPIKNLFRTNTGEMGIAKEVTTRSKSASPTKGFLNVPEIHYRRDDLKTAGEFDIALIREPLTTHGTLTPRPVFSQRFRRFVIDELGVPFGGVPVYIDDDDIIPWQGPYPSKWSHLNRRPEWLEVLQAKLSEGK